MYILEEAHSLQDYHIESVCVVCQFFEQIDLQCLLLYVAT